MQSYCLLAAIAVGALVPAQASAQHQDHGAHHPAQPDTDAPAGQEMGDHDMSAHAPDHAGGHTGDHVMAGHAMHGSSATAMANAPRAISGTALLPAAEGEMSGIHVMTGDWMLMAHGYVWGAYTDQGGPRGDDMPYVASMLMVMADRDLSDTAHLQIKAMGSLEPLMGQPGYPNLFSTGETAYGQPLVDRQHPHDLFMELAARLDFRIGQDTSLFVYGGPVGEPALGPAAFMHRASARYQPLAPISHHWFDSTHITYGVVTAGVTAKHFQLEASAFRGREPDERRWDIEAPSLDSWSVRASWMPGDNWVAQVSHGRLKEPEATHPGQDEARTTASVHYATRDVSATLAWSAKDRLPGTTLTAWLAEANWDVTRHHSLFGRIENVANAELFPDHDDPRHDTKFRVTRFEGGYAYRLPITGPLNLALGGTLAAYAKPAALDAVYGEAPVSYTLFAKLSIGR